MRRDSPYVSQYNKSIPFVKLKLLFCSTMPAKMQRRRTARGSAADEESREGDYLLLTLVLGERP